MIFSHKLPVRGRKQGHVDNAFKLVLELFPQAPRQGTETLLCRQTTQQLASFPTSSPSGDGNSTNLLTSWTLCLGFSHKLPVRGRKLIDRRDGFCQRRSSFSHKLPVRGRRRDCRAGARNDANPLGFGKGDNSPQHSRQTKAKPLPPLQKGGAATAAEGFDSCLIVILWLFSVTLFLCIEVPRLFSCILLQGTEN